jgi:endonuclease/exonuclease/phosphatase (EEP) superfamily protein YafD
MKLAARPIQDVARWSLDTWIGPAVLAAAPWAWFAIRDANPVMNLIAIVLPLLAAAGAVAMTIWAFVSRRPRFALVGFSLVVLTAIVVLEPRLPQRSPAPTAPFRLVSSNTLLGNPTPNAAAAALLRRHADVLVAVENTRTTAEGLDRGFPSVREQQMWGAAVYSRWPLTAPEAVPAPGLADIMRVEVRRPGAPFIVYAVHLGNPLDKTTYTQQAEQVQELLDAAQAERLPVVIAGDFNVSDRSALYRALDRVFRDAMRASFAHSTYDDRLWSLLQLRIDHVFISRNLCARSATTFAVPGSDHDGLEVELGACAS